MGGKYDDEKKKNWSRFVRIRSQEKMKKEKVKMKYILGNLGHSDF